jgi:peroxiredoxin
LLIILIAVIAIVWTLIATLSSERDMAKGTISVGQEAPGFTATNTNGEIVNLINYRGKTVLLNFWASWCKPCVKEMPLLDEAHRTQETEFELISINVGEARGTVNEFVREIGISFPVIVDATGRISNLYQVKALPATFVVDAKSKLHRVSLGELTTKEQLMAILR